MCADEAILTNTNGDIACAATSNVFIVEKGRWITPPLSDGVLAGITRANILAEKLAALEESISPERLRAADEVYLCNSFTGLRKVLLVA
jgi:branched-subunit amino acid aminotransferase/4-amino-4-deoxychorismate lyase